MKVLELVRVLDQLRQLYVLAGASGPATDFLKLIDFLNTHSSDDVSAFITETRERLNQSKQKKPRTLAKINTTATVLNTEAVAHYVACLKSVGASQGAFNDLFSTLKADKGLRLAELTEIAHQYSGGVAKYKSIASVQSEISKAFVRQARFANKLL